MRKKVRFAVQLMIDQHCYRNNEGVLSLWWNTEEEIIKKLKLRIEQYAEIMLPKYFQASITNRKDLDRFIQFTGNQTELPNEWEYNDCTDSFYEELTLNFEVEFYIPQDKKIAKQLTRFTF